MPQIPSYPEKTALADDDVFVIADSAATNATKKVKASTVWKTDLITEKTASAGVTIGGSGGLKNNLYADNGDNILINQITPSRKITLQTLDNGMEFILGGGDLVLTIPNKLTINGSDGFSGTGAYTNFTITKGVVTAAA